MDNKKQAVISCQKQYNSKKSFIVLDIYDYLI